MCNYDTVSTFNTFNLIKDLNFALKTFVTDFSVFAFTVFPVLTYISDSLELSQTDTALTVLFEDL